MASAVKAGGGRFRPGDEASASPRAPAAFWGDRVFTGEVKTKTVFPHWCSRCCTLSPTALRLDAANQLAGRHLPSQSEYDLSPAARLEERGFIRGELDPSTKRGTMLYRITAAGEERLEHIKTLSSPTSPT